MALRYPVWGSFITQVGTRIATRGQLIDIYLTRDLELAKRKNRLTVDSVRVARDIVLGAIFYGIETMLAEPTRANHPELFCKVFWSALVLRPRKQTGLPSCRSRFQGSCQWAQTRHLLLGNGVGRCE